jgi:hypothetical protein
MDRIVINRKQINSNVLTVHIEDNGYKNYDDFDFVLITYQYDAQTRDEDAAAMAQYIQNVEALCFICCFNGVPKGSLFIEENAVYRTGEEYCDGLFTDISDHHFELLIKTYSYSNIGETHCDPEDWKNFFYRRKGKPFKMFSSRKGLFQESLSDVEKQICGFKTQHPDFSITDFICSIFPCGQSAGWAEIDTLHAFVHQLSDIPDEADFLLFQMNNDDIGCADRRPHFFSVCPFPRRMMSPFSYVIPAMILIIFIICS